MPKERPMLFRLNPHDLTPQAQQMLTARLEELEERRLAVQRHIRKAAHHPATAPADLAAGLRLLHQLFNDSERIEQMLARAAGIAARQRYMAQDQPLN